MSKNNCDALHHNEVWVSVLQTAERYRSPHTT